MPHRGLVGAVRSADKLDIFAAGLDGHLYTAAWKPGDTTWRGWWRIGALKVPPGAPVAAVCRSTDKLDVFVTDDDGFVSSAAWVKGDIVVRRTRAIGCTRHRVFLVEMSLPLDDRAARAPSERLREERGASTMRAIVRILVSATLLLAAGASAQASDEARFGALVRRYAPRHLDQFTSFAPKTACICDPGGANAAGVMLSIGATAGCLIPTFVNGSLDSFQPCGSYVVLGK